MVYPVFGQSCVGTPQSVALDGSKNSPAGKVPLMPHSVMVPGPLSTGVNGRSGEVVLLVNWKV